MNTQQQDQLTSARRTVLKTVGAAGLVATFGSQVVTSQSDELLIEDWSDLTAIRENLDQNYILANDIDQNTPGYDTHVATPEAGFNPIGTRETRFTGTFDGQGNEIRDLVIDRPDENYVGLFAETWETNITNISLVNAEVTGGDYVGGLVGINGGVIASASTSGTITGNETVGCLAGYSKENIGRSTASGDVSGTEQAGGLVGFITSQCEITGSAATGNPQLVEVVQFGGTPTVYIDGTQSHHRQRRISCRRRITTPGLCAPSRRCEHTVHQ